MLDLSFTPVVIHPKRQLSTAWKVEEPRKMEVVYTSEAADAIGLPIKTTGLSMYYFPDDRYLGIEVIIQRIAEPWYFCQISESGLKVKARRSELQWAPNKEPLS